MAINSRKRNGEKYMMNFKTVYIYAPHAEERERVKPELQTLFNRLNIKIIDDKQTADIIASVGGDGAFLKAVRDVNFRDDCVYLGIATANKTHFYADFHFNHLEELEDAFLKDNFDSYKHENMNSWQTQMFKALLHSDWFKKYALLKLRVFYRVN